jgi:hypothetical protein
MSVPVGNQVDRSTEEVARSLVRESERAGQGVVQFARRLDGKHLSLYAIKFFASRKDYMEEVNVYRSSPLRTFMPRVLHFESNEDRRIRDPFGGLIPPFIVMEKGESLQERARTCHVDVFTAAQVRRHLTTFFQMSRLSEYEKVSFCCTDLIACISSLLEVGICPKWGCPAPPQCSID